MMTTNLFVIANVKQLRTYLVLEFYCLFSEHLGVLASKIQQFLTVFTDGLSLARFWRAFGISGGGGLNPPQTPSPSVRHWSVNIKSPRPLSNSTTVYQSTLRNIPEHSNLLTQIYGRIGWCFVQTQVLRIRITQFYRT